MGITDWALVALVVGWCGYAIFRRKKHGCCGCDGKQCGHCSDCHCR